MTLSLQCGASYGDARFSRLTPDGRYVAFDSDADDLVENDLNGASDAFLFDLESRTLELISQDHRSGAPANAFTKLPVPSDDARYVAFTAFGYGLSHETPPQGSWVYLRDRTTATTRRFAADYACTYQLDMSGDAAVMLAEGFSNCQGRLDAGDLASVVEYDVRNDESLPLTAVEPGGDNYAPSLSRDGRFRLWAVRPPMTRGSRSSRLVLRDGTTGDVETLPLHAFHYEWTDISDSRDIIAFSENGQVLPISWRTTRTTSATSCSTMRPPTRSSASPSHH